MATPPDFTAGQVLTAAQMNAIGMWLVKSQTIGSAVSSVTVTDAFTDDFEAYRIIISSGVASTDSFLQFNLDGSTTGYYGSFIYHGYGTTGPANAQAQGRQNQASWIYVGQASTNLITMDMTIVNPKLAKFTYFTSNGPAPSTGGFVSYASGYHAVATGYSAFRIVPNTGTLTGGTIRVYGFNAP